MNTEAEIKDIAEELESGNESNLKELIAEANSAKECNKNKEEESLTVNVKTENMSSDSEMEMFLIEIEPKNESLETIEGCSVDNSDVVTNPQANLVAKNRLIRYDSVEIKEEYISDGELNNTADKRQLETSSEEIVIKKKRAWSQNLGKREQGEGEYHRLRAELLDDKEKYYKYFRMSHKAFEELHDILKPNITKCSSFRTAITSRERLTVCLRYLASGESHASLASSFHLGRSTVSEIVRETCKEIWSLLRPVCMPEPTRKIWEESERGFSDIFNFPNCVGCVDGKHVSIRYPHPKKHDNYDKKNSRIVLLTVVDPWCKFTAIDIGDYGFPNELGLFEQTEFFHTYIESLRTVVPSRTLPGSTIIAPRVFIGDETFTLQTFLLRPYPAPAVKADEAKGIFNERLKEPRSVVKDTFDMLVKNWKIFSRPLETDLDTALDVVRACCCLHNYVIKKGGMEDESEVLPEESDPKIKSKKKRPRKTFISHKPSKRRWTTDAGRTREMFVSYFNK